MLKTMLKLESTLNGVVSHLYVEMGAQPLTTQIIAEFCLDFIKQLGVIEAQNKAQAEAQVAAMQAQAEPPMPGVEAPAAPCCQAGESCDQQLG